MLTRFKHVLLFFASPFIALAYLIILPFFGIYMIINIGVERGLLDISKLSTVLSPNKSFIT